jgi:integrase
MIQAGASPTAVQTILGHRSAAFTPTVYGHIFDADLDDLAARLDAPADFARTQAVRLDERRAVDGI